MVIGEAQSTTTRSLKYGDLSPGPRHPERISPSADDPRYTDALGPDGEIGRRNGLKQY